MTTVHIDHMMDITTIVMYNMRRGYHTLDNADESLVKQRDVTT